jgi:hypothetical protein
MFVLIDMLIQDIDEPLKVPTKSTKILFDKLKESQELLMPILDQFYSHKGVSMTNYYQVVQEKIGYNLKREYQRVFKEDLNKVRLH